MVADYNGDEYDDYLCVNQNDGSDQDMVVQLVTNANLGGE